MSDYIIVENNKTTTVIATVEEPKITQTVTSNTIRTDAPEILVTPVTTTRILTDSVQGPPGPPTGKRTQIDQLQAIDEGTGPNKTTIIVTQNTISRGFDIGDELFMQWLLPIGIDKSIDLKFIGSFYPTSSGTDRTSSWEIYITTDSIGTDLGLMQASLLRF